MFTVDTTARTSISFISSGKSACGSDRSGSGVYGQQSQLVIHTLLYGKLSAGTDSAYCIYVGGVTIWLARRSAVLGHLSLDAWTKSRIRSARRFAVLYFLTVCEAMKDVG